jgi:hypothetical protein
MGEHQVVVGLEPRRLEVALQLPRQPLREWNRPADASDRTKESWGRWGARYDAEGRLVHFDSHYDKETDRRWERVEDLETGELIHEQDHPLTEHRGHGSAKPRRSH